MRQILSSIFIFFLLFLFTGCSKQESNCGDLFFFQGMKKIEAGNQDDALIAFQKALRYSPDMENAYLQLGMIYENRRNLVEAVYSYRKFLENAGSEHPDIETVKKWIFDAEKKLFLQLSEKYSANKNKDINQSLLLEPISEVGETEVLKRQLDTYKKHAKALAEKLKAMILRNQKLSKKLKPQNKTKPVNKKLTYYKVKKGDNLNKISKMKYGKEKYWESIFDANKATLKTPGDLQIGQKLIIPDKP